MKLIDILTLAKAGYKMKDIQAMEEAELEEAAKEAEEIEDQPEPEEKEVEPEDTTDYKKLYEESQEALRKAQQDNVRQELSPHQMSDQDILESLFN